MAYAALAGWESLGRPGWPLICSYPILLLLPSKCQD